jgi:hypothetical protein
MAEKPKNYDKWTDINAKIGDYFRDRGYNPDRVDLESNWLDAFKSEFGLRRDIAQEWGFTPDELNKIDQMRYNAQAEVDMRTGFYRGGTLSVPNPNAIPEAEYRRWCQERLGNLDNIIHMWDIFAIAGGPVSAHARPTSGKFKGDVFWAVRGSASSAAISSMRVQRARGYEAFAATVEQDKRPSNRPNPAASDIKTSEFVRSPQSKGPGTGSGPATRLPLSVIYSPETLAEFGRDRNIAQKAADVGLGEKQLKNLFAYGYKKYDVERFIDNQQAEGRKASEIKQKIENEINMMNYFRDQLCGGSMKTAKDALGGADRVVREAIRHKIQENLINEWKDEQRRLHGDPYYMDVLPKMSSEAKNKLWQSWWDQSVKRTKEIETNISRPRDREGQTPPGGANIPPRPENTPPNSAETPSGEANVPGSRGQEVQTPPGGANLPPELKNPPKSEPKPPHREEPKPPSIPVDLERPPEFPITFPPREPGSETLPTKEPQSIQPPSETPQIGDSDNPTQSVAPGKETFPMKEPECISPSSETPSFTLPPLPSESKSWSLPSEQLPPPSESSTSDSGDYSGSYGRAETRGDSGRGSGEGQESGGGDAGIVEGGGGGETGGGEGGI